MKLTTLICTLLISSLTAIGTAQAQEKKLRIGTEAGYAPFEYKNAQGEIVGFDVDVANAICEKLQATCEWIDQPFDSLIPGLQARKFDIIHAGITRSEARERVITFSADLYAIPTQLIAKKDSGLLPSIDSLKGKRVGVLQGSTQEAYARKAWGKEGVTIVSYQEQEQTYGDLQANRLDAVLAEKPNAIAGFLSKTEGKEYDFVGEPISNDPLVENHIAMGMRKADKQLKADVDEAIMQLRKEGVIEKLAKDYFQEGEIGLFKAE